MFTEVLNVAYFLLLAFSSITPANACFGCSWTVGQPVHTSSGLVHGHHAPNATLVSEYLGIPFAKPPVGHLRFAPPIKYTGNRNISGLNYGYSCPQLIQPSAPTDIPFCEANTINAINGYGQVVREDCLTLNVWTKPQIGSDLKPVMIWFYGGGFEGGGSNSTAYSGQYWSNTEDVVFVTFNYRLGVFGFPGAPHLTQNIGLLDQRMAVEWVKDNIAGFGGDPERITIFGQSAGAGSVDLYNYIWLDEPIIQGSIMESGTANQSTYSREVQLKKWNMLAKEIGCGDSTKDSSDTILTCMRDPSKVSMDKLLEATEKLKQSGSSSVNVFKAVFGPTVDEETVFSDYPQRSQAGHFIQKPILAGNNQDELAYINLLSAPVLAGLMKEISTLTKGGQSTQNVLDYFTQTLFSCPSNFQAFYRSSNHVPVWRYRYFPTFPNIAIPNDTTLAYHSAEIFPLFGTDQDISRCASSDAERRLGAFMRGAWATFAHCPDKGLSEKLDWPQYSSSVNNTAGLTLLGKAGETLAKSAARGAYDMFCPPVEY